jgi:MOSC domain-containing protein YiiM
MDLSWRFDFWWRALPRSPGNPGKVEGLVVRTGHGERRTPDEVQVTREDGIVGDAWGENEHDTADNQVALINVHVLRSLAGPDPARMALSGDNLQVDLDLSEENLPPGTHLTIGEVVLAVTEVPHRPCRHFSARFGTTASKKVARANRRGLRGRGLLCTVVQGGTIRRGDSVYVRRVGDWTYNG